MVLNVVCWDGYAPAPLVGQFERQMKDAYGVDVQINVQHVSAPEEFLPPSEASWLI